MAFIKCFWKLNFYFQCLQKNIKIKKIYCPKRTFKNAWFGGPIWWTISKLSIFFFFVYRNIWLWSAPHFASHSVKQGCHRWLHKNKFERCEWVIHLRAEVKRMLSHAHTQTHTYTLTHSEKRLWVGGRGRKGGSNPMNSLRESSVSTATILFIQRSAFHVWKNAFMELE